MRVTYFHYSHKAPAPHVQVSEFARAFCAAGHELSVHVMDKDPMPSWREGAKKALKRPLGRYLHEVNTLRKNLTYYRRECEIVQRERPDIILTRYKLYCVSSAFVAKRFGIPLVAWVHAPYAHQQRVYQADFVQLPGVAQRLEQGFLSMADEAIVISEEIKQYPSFNALNGRMAVIPNGVDPDRFSPLTDGSTVRAEFPVSDPLILGFVGAFAPWHGLESLKAMIACALNTSQRSCILLVGDGPGVPELASWIQQNGWDERRVRFTGHVEHMRVPLYLAAMDICLLPYDQRRQDFYFSPLKLFEYLSCGKPVLAARIGQVEQVIQDGSNGLLYSAADCEDARRKLKVLLDDVALRQRLGANGRKTVLERYTWAHTAHAVEQLFESVLRERQ